jgi:anthrone oxygenase-like protein
MDWSHDDLDRWSFRCVFRPQVQVLFLILILSTATLLGNEFSVGVFIHPALSRTHHERFLPAIQVFAGLFGKIMPFWMAATLLLHLILLGLTWHWSALPTVLLLSATLLWIAIIVFSLIGPVPINNRVKAWDTQKLPPDWQEQRRRWDRLNAIRVVMIALAFLALILSYKTLAA